MLVVTACLLIFARAEADQWSRIKKEDKKGVFDNLFVLIAAMLRRNQGDLSQPFLYTYIFHAQLCLEP